MKAATKHPHQELLATVCAAFNRRDSESVLALMCPGVNWPNGMESGRVQGSDEVRAYWKRQGGIINPHVEPKRMGEHEADNTVVDVHQVVRDLSGNILKGQIVQHVYSFRGDLIGRMDIRKSDAGLARKNSD